MQACEHLKKALGQAPGKLKAFKSGYPDFYQAPCVQRIIKESRKASE